MDEFKQNNSNFFKTIAELKEMYNAIKSDKYSDQIKIDNLDAQIRKLILELEENQKKYLRSVSDLKDKYFVNPQDSKLQQMLQEQIDNCSVAKCNTEIEKLKLTHIDDINKLIKLLNNNMDNIYKLI
jgi:hypothetical protein